MVKSGPERELAPLFFLFFFFFRFPDAAEGFAGRCLLVAWLMLGILLGCSAPLKLLCLCLCLCLFQVRAHTAWTQSRDVEWRG